jgi:hypothetical protein
MANCIRYLLALFALEMASLNGLPVAALTDEREEDAADEAELAGASAVGFALGTIGVMPPTGAGGTEGDPVLMSMPANDARISCI